MTSETSWESGWSARTVIAYGVLVAVISLRFVPLIFGNTWLWGVGHLTLLPDSFIAGFAIVAAAIILLPWIIGSKQPSGTAVARVAGALFSSRHSRIVWGVTILAAGGIFVIGRTPTHFLGDGYQFLGNIGSDAGHWVKWSEGGAMLTVMAVRSISGPPSEVTALHAFQLVSIASGMLAIWFYFLIAREISTDSAKRLITFLSLLFAASLLLFFGYVESYPVMWGPLAGFLYFSLRYSNQGRGLIPALFFLFVAIFLHLQNAMYLPAVGFLLLSRGAGLTFFRKYRTAVIGIAAAICAATLFVFFRKYTTDLSVEVIFLYPFTGKPASPEYAIFSPRHLADIANLFLLVFPTGVVMASLADWSRRRWSTDRTAIYLGLLSAGSLLFLLVIDPGLSMPRDWDLFSSCSLAPFLLLMHLVPEKRLEAAGRLIPSILVATALLVVPWLAVNLSESRSVSEIKSIIDNNPDKSLGSMTILGSYYEKRGAYRQVDSVNQLMERRYTDFYRWKAAFLLLKDGKDAEAYRLVAQTRPDRFSKDYQSIMAGYFLKTGQADSALAHARAAQQLQPYVDQTYALLAYAHMLKGEKYDALEALRQGFELNQRNLELIKGLSLLHCALGNFDSTISYAQRFHEVDSTDAIYHYMLAKGYLGMSKPTEAIREANLYMEWGKNGSGYQQNAQELQRLFSGAGSTR